MVRRQPTAPYPDNPRSEWAIRMMEWPNFQADGLLHFAYAVYPTVQSMAAGDLPFLLNSHKAMVRENHQRIRLDANGYMRHRSGIAVPPQDVEEFLRTDPRAYRWISGNLAEWKDGIGRTSRPFVFPTYWKQDEALDPQWVRETFIVPQAQQVQELIDQYLAGVEARRLTGDHRGTTWDLQVAAGADDGYIYYTASPLYQVWNATDVGLGLGCSTYGSGQFYDNWHRFTGVSGLGGIVAGGGSIDVATLSLWGGAYGAEVGTPQTQIYAEDASAPAAPTSYANFTGKTKTTASVAWDNPDLISTDFKPSPSIVSIIQELDASYTPTAIQILHYDDLRTDSANLTYPVTYEGNSARAAKLYIEYTAGGGTAVPVFEHHYRQMRSM